MTRLRKIEILMSRLAEQKRRHGPTATIQSELIAARTRDLKADIRLLRRLSGAKPIRPTPKQARAA